MVKDTRIFFKYESKLYTILLPYVFRLYSEKDFDNLVDYPTPEILRMPLDSLILQLVSMGIEVRTFPFLEKPPDINFNESLAFLQQQGALKSGCKYCIICCIICCKYWVIMHT